MQLKRISCLLSLTRLRACFRFFRQPLCAFWRTACLGNAPFQLTLKSGESLSFSRKDRDHKLWDWLLTARVPVDFSFTASGNVNIEWNARRFLLRPATQDPFIFQEILIDDIYGLMLVDTPLRTVIDLGANAGFFSCTVLGRAERVIAVEAVDENYRHAVENIRRNGGARDDIFRLAMSGTSGRGIKIQHDERNSGGHFVVDHESAPAGPIEIVESITLSDLMRRTNCHSVDLLKCDIEGSEYDVFLNTPVNDLRKIRQLVMEVHLSPCHPPRLLRQMIEHFESAGFVVTLSEDIPDGPIQQNLILTALRTNDAMDDPSRFNETAGCAVLPPATVHPG